MIIQGSPEILRGPQGLNGFGDFGETATPQIALDLVYRSSTTGASTAEFDKYGGYWSVKNAAVAAGYTGTPEWIQNYEITNNLPESAYTKLNKQFIANDGTSAAALAQLELDISSANAALAEQTRLRVMAQAAAADAEFQREQAARAAIEAANKKAIADAYAAAQAASKAAVEASTLAAKQAAEALRVRALVAVKALYLQVLGREGDQAGLDYFADRFGDVIDPDELQIFSDMAQPEIDARNKYLADMAAKSKEDAAKAKAIADQFAATAAKAKADAAAATGKVVDTTTGGGGGGISPVLILAAAAAAFFIGG